jgi:hypothetical protein
VRGGAPRELGKLIQSHRKYQLERGEERWSVGFKPVLLAGSVARVFPVRGRLQRSSGFEITIPTYPGMSGSPVLIDFDGKALVCGVVSSDNSPMESKVDFTTAGSTACVPLWNAMAIKLPLGISIGQCGEENQNAVTVLDLIRMGIVSDQGNAHVHTKLLPTSTGFRVSRPMDNLQEYLPLIDL